MGQGICIHDFAGLNGKFWTHIYYKFLVVSNHTLAQLLFFLVQLDYMKKKNENLIILNKK